MKPYTSNYMKFFGYDESSFIACECCERQATSIHHIIPKSKFGKRNKDKQDEIGNIMALCNECHEEYGQKKKYLEYLQKVHQLKITLQLKHHFGEPDLNQLF